MALPPRPNLTSKVVCVLILLGALIVLREDNFDEEHDGSGQRHWAVWAALRKHPPSLRIFRSLLEWNLVLWGTVVSLTIWYRYVGRAMVAELLFAPAFAGPTDYGDHHAGVNDKLRSSTYSNLRFADAEEEVSLQSEIMFDDPNDDMRNSLQTGIKPDEKGSVLFHMHKGQPHFDKSDDDCDNDEDDDEEDTTMGKASQISEAPSGFDAQSAPQAPSVPMTASAALDMLLPILIALFLFTLLSTQEMKHWAPQITWVAPLIPLVLVVYLTITQLFRPWRARKQFFTVISWTIGAPMYPVTFRDGFIGDIFTSTVRPLQDVAFTLCYILSGLQGYWSDGYDGFWDNVKHNPHHLNDDDDAVAAMATEAPHSSSLLPPLETSWWLHTVLLPMCMVSPLWWRFLQNLRQTHDNQRRWPYLGNAFKYLLAAEVAMFGVFDPSKQQTYLWLGWFVIATLYQVWWDIWMDWELLVYSADNGKWFPFRLRDKRLYPRKSLYWNIMIINVMLRFCWTLSFLPPRYLNQAGVLSDNFQHSDWSRALAPAIASAEILRRTLWGWIRLENEAIKVAAEQENPLLPPQKILELQLSRGQDPEEAFGDPLDGMEPMGMDIGNSSSTSTSIMPRWNNTKKQGLIPALWENCKTMEGNSEISIMAELACWATVFATVGLIAAAHRMTL